MNYFYHPPPLSSHHVHDVTMTSPPAAHALLHRAETCGLPHRFIVAMTTASVAAGGRTALNESLLSVDYISWRKAVCRRQMRNCRRLYGGPHRRRAVTGTRRHADKTQLYNTPGQQKTQVNVIINSTFTLSQAFLL